MFFDIIVATGIAGEIAINGKIPWHCTEDLRFFRSMTMGNVIIMGRKTWLSLPHKLSSRINIVCSSSEIEGPDHVCNSLEQALKLCRENYSDRKVYVIGGAQLYESALQSPWFRKLYLNLIIGDYMTDGKKLLFPNFNLRLTKTEVQSGNVVYHIYERNNQEELDYLNLLREILDGSFRQTRNAETYSIFAKQLCFDLKYFPLLTTKKMFLRGIFEELMWMLRGQTSSKILEEKGVNIWRENTSIEFIASNNLDYKEGDIGNMYGFQLRHYGEDYQGFDKVYQGYDQIEYCLNLLRTDKYSRRILMTTYSPSTAHKGVLYPCHGICTQFYVREENGDEYLDCSMTQRSADAFLGLPFNIASYALLVYLFCEVLNFKPGRLSLLLNDVHIYSSHLDCVNIQLNREPYTFPTLRFRNSHSDIRDYNWDDLELSDYNHYPAIKTKMIK